MYNAFKLTKQLEEVGFSREQAEQQIQVVTEMIQGDLATKQDLEKTGTLLKHEISLFKGDFKQEIALLKTDLENQMHALKTDLKNQMHALKTDLENQIISLKTNLENRMDTLENRLTIKLGAMMVIGFTSMITLMKVWGIH